MPSFNKTNVFILEINWNFLNYRRHMTPVFVDLWPDGFRFEVTIPVRCRWMETTSDGLYGKDWRISNREERDREGEREREGERATMMDNSLMWWRHDGHAYVEWRQAFIGWHHASTGVTSGIHGVTSCICGVTSCTPVTDESTITELTFRISKFKKNLDESIYAIFICQARDKFNILEGSSPAWSYSRSITNPAMQVSDPSAWPLNRPIYSAYIMLLHSCTYTSSIIMLTHSRMERGESTQENWRDACTDGIGIWFYEEYSHISCLIFITLFNVY